MRRILALLLSGMLLANISSSWAAECATKSGPQRTSLLELYTSEGCSSCPPADAWLRNLSASNLSAKVVPLAFHVDYWDYIGWKDRFAKAEFSQRQRRAVGFGSFVYTPQVMLNGRDFRGWQNGQLDSRVAQAAVPSTVSLNLRISSAPEGKSQLMGTAENSSSGKQPLNVYIALYESGLKSQVNAGENNGRELQHDYVVQQLLGPYPLNSGWSQTLTLPAGWQSRNGGVAAFVQEQASGEVVQALALPFCNEANSGNTSSGNPPLTARGR